MGVSFIPCPSCQTMLLGDTAQCPECGHVLDESRAALLAVAAQAPSAESGPADDEVACPACGEHIRAESVRCWKCGTFLRNEMAEAFQRMQAGERNVGAAVPAAATRVSDGGTSTIPGSDPPQVRESDDVVVPAEVDDFVMGAGWDDSEEDAGYLPSFVEPTLRAEEPPQGPPPGGKAAPSKPVAAPVTASGPAVGAKREGKSRPESRSSGQWDGVPALGSDPPPGQIVFDDLDEFPEDDPRAKLAKDIQAVLTEADEASRDLLNRILNEMGVEESDEPASHEKIRAFLQNVAPEEEEAAARLAEVVAQKAAEEAEVAAKRAAAEHRAAQKKAEEERLGAEEGPVLPPPPKIPPGYIAVFCPNGHQIPVKEERRGKTGRCRICREKFCVPEHAWDGLDARLSGAHAAADGSGSHERSGTDDSHAEFYLELDGASAPDAPSGPAPQVAAAVEAGAAVSPSAEPATTGTAATLPTTYDLWMDDVCWYQVAPAKVKQAPGALVGKHEAADLGFAAGRLAIVRLVKKGLFGAVDKKAVLVRDELRAHLAKGGEFQDQPIAGFEILDAASLHQIGFEQPGADENAVFGGVPVFPEDWITVRMPQSLADSLSRFVSLPLSRFREFAKLVAAAGGPADLGADLDLPLKDAFDKGPCIVTKQEVRWLVGSGYYLADPGLETTIVGWKCAACGLVMSEAGREKANFGGKKAKGIATTSCLKCKKPFGRIPLVLLERKR